jgi:hypothetical protein
MIPADCLLTVIFYQNSEIALCHYVSYFVALGFIVKHSQFLYALVMNIAHPLPSQFECNPTILRLVLALSFEFPGSPLLGAGISSFCLASSLEVFSFLYCSPLLFSFFLYLNLERGLFWFHFLEWNRG